MKLKVKIISPDAILHEGEADYIVVPGRKGRSLGLLPGHTPMFAEVATGTLVVHNGSDIGFEVDGGILKIASDVVTILVAPA